MINKLISLAIFAFIGALSMTELSAQTELTKTKIVILEKEMDDNGKLVEKKVVLEGEEAEKYLKENQEIGKIVEEEVETTMEGQKKMISKSAFKIKVKNENGEEEIIEWDGQGEMPEKMKEIWEKEGMDLSSGEMQKSHKGLEKEKKVRIKTIDSESGKTIEWDGEGEMPEGLEELLEKEGIDIGSLMDETEEMTQTITMDDSGSGKRMKIIKKGAGLEEVMDLDWEGDVLPDDVREILEQEGIALEEIIGEDGEKQIKIIKSAKVKATPDPKGKPQLGVMIEAGTNGVLVSEIVPESSADEGGIKARDIITSLDGKTVKTTKDLIEAVKEYVPGDVVKVGLTRQGEAMTKDVTLKAYVDPYPFKTWEEVMDHGKTKEIEIEKKIIIKKDK